MKSLNQFAGYRQVFKDAQILPPFFQTNLVDPSRVVKLFQNDPQSQIRIFYYQYLKLCFELQNVDYDMYIRKIEEIINNVDFQFIFYPNDDGSIYNDTQAKSLIMEFFGILGEGSSNVLQSLTKYPIMDKILVHFFRSIIILSNVTDSLDSYIQREKLLNFLCQTFDVQANIYGQCIKYVDTDIFVYQLNQYAVYMAYMDYDNYSHSAQQSPQVAQPQQPAYQEVNTLPYNNFYGNPVGNIGNWPQSNRKDVLAKDSYIADQFIDFTSNGVALSSKAKQVAKQVYVGAAYKEKVQIQKPVPKSQILPTATALKQVPKQVSLQSKQNYYKNVNQSIIEIKSIPPPEQSYIYRAQNKPDLSRPQVNHLQRAYLTETVQYSEQGSKSFSNSVHSNNDQFTRLTQNPVPAPTKDSIFNQIQRQTYQPPVQQTLQQSQQPLKQQVASQEQYLPYSSINTKQPKNDVFYNSKFQNSALNIEPYFPPKFQSNPKDIQPATIQKIAIKKQASVLNDFTSDQITRFMPQPHRTNIQLIKERQRKVWSS